MGENQNMATEIAISNNQPPPPGAETLPEGNERNSTLNAEACEFLPPDGTSATPGQPISSIIGQERNLRGVFHNAPTICHNTALEWPVQSRDAISTEHIARIVREVLAVENFDNLPRNRDSKNGSGAAHDAGNGSTNDRDYGRTDDRDYGRTNDRDYRRTNDRDYGHMDDRDYGRTNDRDYGRMNDRDYGRMNDRDYGRTSDRDYGRTNDRDYGRMDDRDYRRTNDRDYRRTNDREYGRTNDREYGRIYDRGYGRADNWDSANRDGRSLVRYDDRYRTNYRTDEIYRPYYHDNYRGNQSRRGRGANVKRVHLHI